MTTTCELPHGKPEEVGISGERLNKISDVVQEFMDTDRIQGAVVGVTRRNKVVYLQAQGVQDDNTQVPLREDALFHMASSTKPITGVAAMMTIEQGLFAPSDPVESYIPEFSGIQVAVLKEPSDEDVSPMYVFGDVPEHRLVDSHRPVTIHDLLTHTSGLASSGLGNAVSSWDRRTENDTLASWIPKIAAGPLDFQPGTRWAYSASYGLDVVARIMEILWDTPFNEFVQKRIFDPLDMKDTHWVVPQDKLDRMLVIRHGKGGWKNSTSYYSASHDLISTVRDYMHFEQMLLNKGTLFGRQLIKPESVAMMSTNQVGSLFSEAAKSGKGTDGGLGCGYTVSITLDPELSKDGRSAGAFGWGGAAGTMSWTDPEKEMTCVVMVQQPTELPYFIAAAIRDAIDD